MYTRRYPIPPRPSSLVPPPDYSGTAIRPMDEEAQGMEMGTPIAHPTADVREKADGCPSCGTILIPPPPMERAEERSAEADQAMAEPPAPPDSETPKEADTPAAVMPSARRRSRLRGRMLPIPHREPPSHPPHREEGCPTMPRRPILPPFPESGFRPPKRRTGEGAERMLCEVGASPLGGIVSNLHADEWLLIGLLILLLTGGEEEVKGHLDLILLLGALLLIGR